MQHELMVETSDGQTLQSVATSPAEAPTAVAVLCHPHPLHGGSMDVPILTQLAGDLEAASIASVRFNFRGVGKSSGMHGFGDTEPLDVAAVVNHASEQWPDLPVHVAGWSFGADISLTCVDPAIAQWLCIAPPLRSVEAAAMLATGDERPKTLFVPEHDQFNPPPVATAYVSDWNNVTLELVAGTDHFLQGQVAALSQRIAERVRNVG